MLESAVVSMIIGSPLSGSSDNWLQRAGVEIKISRVENQGAFIWQNHTYIEPFGVIFSVTIKWITHLHYQTGNILNGGQH